MSTTTAPQLTLCCGQAFWQGRCTGCGHRMPVDGVMAQRTREIALRRPWFVVVELIHRARAKHARRFYATEIAR